MPSMLYFEPRVVETFIDIRPDTLALEQYWQTNNA
jgi:hypothetical protein